MAQAPAWPTRNVDAPPGNFTIEVNGEQHTVSCHPETPLLYVLRNDLELKGSRFGCGLGQCGACFVLFDGHPTPSCDLPIWSVEGHQVVTVEGLGEGGELSTLQRCFIEEQAAQCAYCMSGILISATALLKENPSPDESEIRAALDRNLCRCGSHSRVIRAVQKAAEVAQ